MKIFIDSEGILCYGFVLISEKWLDEGKFFDDFVGEKYGFANPFLQNAEWIERRKKPINKEQFDEIYQRLSKEVKLDEYRQRIRKLIYTEIGIDLVFYASDDYPLCALAIYESIVRINRGFAKGLGQCIISKPEWRETLKSFCDKTGIQFQEPQFLLCS